MNIKYLTKSKCYLFFLIQKITKSLSVGDRNTEGRIYVEKISIEIEGVSTIIKQFYLQFKNDAL